MIAPPKYTLPKPALTSKPLTSHPTTSTNLEFKAFDLTQRRYAKILMTGEPDTGKTRCIYDLLCYDENIKVFCINSDLGGSGSETIIEALVAGGREDLVRNYQEVEIAEYDLVIQHLYNLDKIRLSNGLLLWEWKPTWLIWEGFTNYQERLQDYVLTNFQPKGGEDEEGNSRRAPDPRRVEAFKAEMQDWDGIARGSSRHFDYFLRLSNPLTGEPLNKIMTCYWRTKEQTVQLNKAKKSYEGPAIAGQFKDKFLGGFNLVLRTRKDIQLNKRVYFYDIHKRRGYDQLPVSMKADFHKILDVITKHDYKGIEEVLEVEEKEEANNNEVK